MKDITKIKKRFIRYLSLTAIVLLAACSLPEVTPPVETTIPTEPPFIVTNTESPSPTVAAFPAPVEITNNNAASLTMVNRAPVNTAQLIKWANDSLSLAVSTQNTDASGNQLFGVSVLAVPGLTPTNIMSTKDGRVADISSNGKLAALVSLDMTSISLVDLTAANTVVLTISPDFLVGNATFSPDGATLAVTIIDEWKVVLYSSIDGSLVNTLTGFESAAPIYNAGFTQSPQWIVWHARATLQLQEIVNGNFGPTLDHQDFVTAYAMTRDGSMLASNVSTAGIDPAPAVTLWDAAGGNVLRTFELTEPALCIDFSPNGTLLAMGVGSALQIWDVTSGSMLTSLDGHAGQITALAFSTDGKFLATIGNDNQLFLWQVSE
ncbi:MAG: WD40 repeat domain-containing protein [Anaerolineaceae bacterium]